jgi:diaminohydroxyphosphoribosylaminopyrimidine deaminase/5-amino-6-(5-phosphoribosylamino)uracil reductase
VHIAALDPNPRTDGSGVARLEQASVSVVLREGSPESFALIEAFAKHITTGIPFVVAKFAMSLDGKIATRSGDSKWISNIAARRHAHVLRAGVDAVMVGIGTALADDPQLTVRGITYAGPQPTRVIIDSTGRLPIDASMLALEGTTIVATSNIAPDKRTALETAGAVIIDTGPGIQVDLHHLLVALGEQQITSVLVEGGSHLLGSLFDLGLVDKVVSIIAPVIIGGIEAPGPVSGGGAQAMPDALRLTKVTYEQVDGDIIVTGYPPTRRT